MTSKLAHAELRSLEHSVRALRVRVERASTQWLAAQAPLAIRPEWRGAAQNLADYLALRAEDLAPLQERLSHHGLSSLGRLEGRVGVSLDALLATLSRLAGRPHLPYPTPNAALDLRRQLNREVDALFGPDPNGPGTRILVTLPDDAAERPGHVGRLIEAGADLFRINCAHGDPESWAASIAAVRLAERPFGRRCRILMDLAGPKIRIAQVDQAEARLHIGSRFRLASEEIALGASAIPAAFIPYPDILAAARLGDTVWFDDGKLQAEVIARSPGAVDLMVRRARRKGVRLKPGKGLAFPDQDIALPALTEPDLAALDFVARHADLVGFSFVQRREDVAWLQEELARRRPGLPELPIVLKVETRLAVANLPELIVQAASRAPAAVMIARGDLALGVGFAELSALQEQILWLCEAAAVPVIWATQVLESLVKDGIPTRGEATDAASGQRADCVMLNKGPHQVEAVAFLDEVLRGMDRHMAKKSPVMGALKLWTPPACSAQDA